MSFFSYCSALFSYIVFACVGTGWFPFLLHGIAEQRKGGNGKGFIVTACIWLAVLGVMAVIFVGGVGLGPMVSIGAILSGLGMLFLAVAWLPLFTWSALVWLCTKTSGKWRTLAAGAWGLVAVSIIGYNIYSVETRYAFKTFDPATYQGEAAAVEFPYTGKGNVNLLVFPKDGKPYVWTVEAVETNRMVIPVGDYREAQLSICLEGAQLSISFDTPFSVAKDEVFVFPGGRPFVASIDAQKYGGDRINLDFKFLDSAGNKITYRGVNGKIGFEALTPGGDHFWRGDFEWG